MKTLITDEVVTYRTPIARRILNTKVFERLLQLELLLFKSIMGIISPKKSNCSQESLEKLHF